MHGGLGVVHRLGQRRDRRAPLSACRPWRRSRARRSAPCLARRRSQCCLPAATAAGCASPSDNCASSSSSASSCSAAAALLPTSMATASADPFGRDFNTCSTSLADLASVYSVLPTSTPGRKSFSSVENSSSVKRAARGLGIGLARAHRFQVELHRNVAVEGDHLLAEQDGVAVVEQRLAVSLLLDLGGVVERGFNRAEAADQLHRSLVADAGRAGDVVDGVAAQRHHVHHPLGRHAQDLFHLGAGRRSGCPWAG